MKKRKIINIVLIACIAIGIFFVIRFDLVSKIENKIYQQKIKNEILAKANEKYSDKPESITETLKDKDGNEIVVEMRKIVVKDENTGHEVLMYEDIAEPKIIYSKTYKGKIERIEDRRIYFIVDEEFSEPIFGSGTTGYHFKDVKNYQIIFDFGNYNLAVDTSVGYFVSDHLTLDFKSLDSVEDLEKVVGRYIRVQDSKYRDYYTGGDYKVLSFFTE